MLDSKFITVPNVDTLNKISISNKSIIFITGTGLVYTHGKYFPNTDSLSALDVATKTWVGNNYLPLSGGTLTGSLTTTKIHSNAVAADVNLSRIPNVETEVVLETGNGDGGKSAWLWRELWAATNTGIFHDNSNNILYIVGEGISKLNLNLASGELHTLGEIYASGSNKVLHAANYNSYAPKLDGTRATGNWSINAAHLLINGVTWGSNWTWSGLSGQPSWLWGSKDGVNMYIWNPSNFHVSLSDKLAVNTTLTYGTNGLQYLNAHNLNTSNSPSENSAPDSNWWHIIRMNHGNSGGWLYADLAFALNNTQDAPYFRIVKNGSVVRGWSKFITSDNIGSQSVTSATKLTGPAHTSGTDGWFRSDGTTGWYNETYGGGWYMTDTTYVRTYNGKTVLGNGFYHSGYGSSSYLLTSDGGVTATSTFATSSHTHNYADLNNLIIKGDEHNFIPASYSGSIYINYQDRTYRNSSAYITEYCMCNGRSSYAAIRSSGYIITGYDNTYIVLAGGGAKLISELSVSSAVNADTLDGQHGAYYATASALDTVNGKFSKYLPLSGGTMDNANVVNSLNADLLDGMHASHFITSKDSNISLFRNEAGSNLTYYWGYNGGSNDTYAVPNSSMSVGYASSAGNADTVDSQHFVYSNDSNSPTYLWGTSTTGTNFLVSRANLSVTESTHSGYLTRYSTTAEFNHTCALSYFYDWDNTKSLATYFYGINIGSPDSKLSTELAMSLGDHYLHYRITSGSTSWGTWNTLLDSANYNSYSPKLDGTGATGTWHINITGELHYSSDTTQYITAYDHGLSFWNDTNRDSWDLFYDGYLKFKYSHYVNTTPPIAHRVFISTNESSYTLSEDLTATKFINPSSSDSYVLLGGGGTFKLSKASDTATFGTIPSIGTDGVLDIGRYIDFHYDNSSAVDYSTRLYTTGNYGNSVILPSSPGTLALISDLSGYLPLSGGTMTGCINMTPDTLQLNFRPNKSTYSSGVMYQTKGQEALVFANMLSSTSFMFVNGVNPSSMTYSYWTGASPALLIKQNSVYVNKLIPSGLNPDFEFYVDGTSRFTESILCDTQITATAFYESSDIRMKSNIMDIINSDRASEILLKQFNFNNETKTKYGVIALDLIALGFNDLVSLRDDGMYSVDYTSLLILEVDMLKRKVKQLELKLNEL